MIVLSVLTGGWSSFLWELQKFSWPGIWSTAGGGAKGANKDQEGQWRNKMGQESSSVTEDFTAAEEIRHVFLQFSGALPEKQSERSCSHVLHLSGPEETVSPWTAAAWALCWPHSHCWTQVWHNQINWSKYNLGYIFQQVVFLEKKMECLVKVWELSRAGSFTPGGFPQVFTTGLIINIYSYMMSYMIVIQYFNKISLKYIFYIGDLHCEGFYKSPWKVFIKKSFKTFLRDYLWSLIFDKACVC